jgi:hypothetical protein
LRADSSLGYVQEAGRYLRVVTEPVHNAFLDRFKP